MTEQDKYERMLVDINITFPSKDGLFTLKREGIKYNEGYELVKKLVEENPEVENLQRDWNKGSKTMFGCYGHSHGEYNWTVSSYLPSIEVGEKHTCPRRKEAFNHWKDEVNEDKWNKIGETRVCSYCGSLHPEDFLHIIETCIETNGEGASVEWSDKNYKLYASYTGTQNASQGGIKFYVPHAFTEQFGQIWVDKLNPRLKEAVKITWEKHKKVINNLRNINAS